MKKLATLVLCALMLFSTVMPVTTLAKTKKCTHKNTTWVTTSKATCTATGTKVKKCKNCGKILKTKKIKLLLKLHVQPLKLSLNFAQNAKNS